jgi:hypothetical protein
MKAILTILFFLSFLLCRAQMSPVLRFYDAHIGLYKTDTSTFKDADAQAFIDSAAITDATQKAAIYRLVADLKGIPNALYATLNIWDSLKAIYPFVGGNLNAHKRNLKDPRDLDAAFRMTFTGTPTHTSNGVVTGNSGYGDTHLVQNVNLFPNSLSMGMYFTTDAVANGNNYCIGFRYNPSDEEYILVKWTTANGTYMYIYPGLGSPYITNDSRGYYSQGYSSTRKSSVFHGRIATINVGNSYTYGTAQGYIGAYSGSGGVVNIANTLQTWGFAFYGGYLNAIQQNALYNAVQQFETTLGRAVN